MANRDGELIFNIFSQEIEKHRNVDREKGSPTRQNSWKPQLRKIQSRLRDPPEESPCPKTDDDRDSLYGKEDDDDEYNKRANLTTFTLFQCLILAVIVSALGLSLCVPILKRQKLWELPLWKWEILVLALISGHLVSGWVVRLAVVFIERNFLLKKRVLYFVYGLRRSVQNCLWLGIVLLTWHSVFHQRVSGNKVLPYVTKALICFLVATVFWLLKTLVLKVLALSFHVNNFFERIQEALFNQFVVETLSGPPMMTLLIDGHDRAVKEASGELRESLLQRSKSPGHKIPLSHENVSAWNMRRMVNTLRHGVLTTLDERIRNSDTGDESSLHIKTECQANEAARKIFTKVAKPGSQYIYLDDLMPFMSKDEATKTMHHFGAEAENHGISKSALNDWVRERRALALSLTDTKTAVEELHGMLSFIVGIAIVITSLFILGIPITHFLVFISSQLFLAAFIFGNTLKTVFEAIIFLFVVHPFDIGDRCEVDGIQMVVEEMNILTTVFMRNDDEKIIYPNCVLAKKPIINHYRNPAIGLNSRFLHQHFDSNGEDSYHERKNNKVLKISISNLVLGLGYVESRSDHWNSETTLIMRGFEGLNRVRLSLSVTQRVKHEESRGLLVEEIVKILKEVGIEYWMVPPHVNSARSFFPGSTFCDTSAANWTAFFAADEMINNSYAGSAF